jgi:hypothetical protein
MDRERRRLVHSPTDRNECVKLELLRAWEPSNSSGLEPPGKGQAAQFGFPDGNQIKT